MSRKTSCLLNPRKELRRNRSGVLDEHKYMSTNFGSIRETSPFGSLGSNQLVELVVWLENFLEGSNDDEKAGWAWSLHHGGSSMSHIIQVRPALQ